ncbi:MAG TPA: AI-2E family transporter [Candidatus Acidoferrales bacterium]|nr:AI-2E family transporter [Candidatus Acidoferrales bacterium]
MAVSSVENRSSERRRKLCHAEVGQLSRTSSRPDIRHLLGIVTAVVVVAALYFARVVFIPVALASLVAVILTPAVSFLERRHLYRSAAIFVVMATLVCVAGLIGWTVLPQFVDLMAQLPKYEEAIQHKVDALKGKSGGKLSNATQSVKSLENGITKASNNSFETQNKKASPPGSSAERPLAVEMVNQSSPLQAVKGLADPLATGIAVLVFAIFILASREDLRNRLIKLTSGGKLTLMTQAMSEAWNRINRYLFMQMLMNCCYGLIVGISLHFLGVPKAALWGFATGLLRYLPYIGWMIAAAMPTGLALAVFPGWEHAIITICIFVGLEMIVANAIEPIVYGAHVGMAPLAILIAAIFWTLIWGFPGLLLSTPMTVCLVVVGRYVPSLGFFSILLGNEPAMAPHAQFYQRLLAGDENEARQILENCLKEKTLEDLYDSVLIPALARSEQDGHRNELDEETRSFIDSTTRELAEELVVSHMEGHEADDRVLELQHSPQGSSGAPKIVCIPARDEADEVVALLVCQLLERRGINAESLAIASAAEMVAQSVEMRAEMICVSALPPLAMKHTRMLYARLRSQAPDVPIAVCLWNFEGDPQKTANLLHLSSRDRFFTSLTAVLRYFSGHESEIVSELPHETHAV